MPEQLERAEDAWRLNQIVNNNDGEPFKRLSFFLSFFYFVIYFIYLVFETGCWCCKKWFPMRSFWSHMVGRAAMLLTNVARSTRDTLRRTVVIRWLTIFVLNWTFEINKNIFKLPWLISVYVQIIYNLHEYVVLKKTWIFCLSFFLCATLFDKINTKTFVTDFFTVWSTARLLPGNAFSSSFFSLGFAKNIFQQEIISKLEWSR